jgi:hypothetical protein
MAACYAAHAMSKDTPKKYGPKRAHRELAPSKTRVPDKLPMRAPRRPAAARYEQGRRTGAKKRLGH